MQRNRLGSVSLIVAAVGFIAANLLPWPEAWRFPLVAGMGARELLAAFFDAALVGALADWFAVSALFRHPFGLKLPHTNVIAHSKEALSQAVPRFLAGFVSGDSIRRELGQLDFAAQLEAWLNDPLKRELAHGFVRARLVALAKDREAEAENGNLVEALLTMVASDAELPNHAAQLVAWSRQSGFAAQAVGGVAGLIKSELDRNHEGLVVYLTQKLKQNAGWQAIFIGQGTSEKILAAVGAELESLRSDPASEIRRFLFSAMDSWAAELRRTGPQRERFHALCREALGNPAFLGQARGFFNDLVQRLGSDLEAPDSRLVGTVERLEDAVLARLQSDLAFRDALNRNLAGLVAELVDRSRVVETLSDYLGAQMRATDTVRFVASVERAVWNDLQYIRVNGAVVGGLAGLALAFVRALVPY